MQSLCWHAGKSFLADLFPHANITRVLRAHLFTSRTAPLDRQELLQLPKIHLVKINPLEKQLACSYMIMEFRLNWIGEVTQFSALKCRRAESHYHWQHFLSVWLMFQIWEWLESYTKENIQYSHISFFRKNASFHTSLSFSSFVHVNLQKKKKKRFDWILRTCTSNCIKKGGGEKSPPKIKEQKGFIIMDHVSTFSIWRCHISE